MFSAVSWNRIAVSKIKYFNLIDEFCLLPGIVQPRIQPGMITDGGVLHIDDVAFSLLHNELIDEDLLFIYADFGVLPPGRELQASTALLEANLCLYNGAAPVFAISAVSGRAVMAQHDSLAALNAQSLSVLLLNMAKKARQWRGDFFLNPETSPFQLPA
jgi:hypothetical protein